jgi:hypothetical protein
VQGRARDHQFRSQEARNHANVLYQLDHRHREMRERAVAIQPRRIGAPTRSGLDCFVVPQSATSRNDSLSIFPDTLGSTWLYGF